MSRQIGTKAIRKEQAVKPAPAYDEETILPEVTKEVVKAVKTIAKRGRKKAEKTDK